MTKVPSLGDSITEGTVVKWNKSTPPHTHTHSTAHALSFSPSPIPPLTPTPNTTLPLPDIGDQVEQDEVIVIIETDKVSVDIRAHAAGQLKAQKAKESDTVKVGDGLAEIDTAASGSSGGGSSTSEQPSKAPPAEAKQPAQQPSAAPSTGDAQPASSTSQPHVHKARASHSSVSEEGGGEELTPESPKAQSGTTTQDRSNSQPGSKQVDKLEGGGKPTAKPAPAAPASSSPSKPSTPSSSSPSSSTPSPSSTPTPGARGVRRVVMSRMRQTIAKRLKDAQNTAAMLTTFNEVDMSALMDVRSRYKDEFFERSGVKLGFMSAFVRASTAALQKFPDVNASIEGNEVVYRDYVDVSVAVSTPTGLVVPVLRNAEAMSFAQVEAAIAALGQKARKGQISLEDMTGGTFTISNGGVYGSLFGTPILNPPQSAILGMHGIFKRPVAVNDAVVIRPMMYIALTYDHRIVDGSTAVQFLKEIKQNIEDPVRLLLNV